MSGQWLLIVPVPSPSRNTFHHKHWRFEYTVKKKWEKWLSALLLDTRIPQANGRRHITITRFGKRKLDYDNLVGGLKGPIDCLCKLGLLKGDSPELAEFVFKQELDRVNPRTEIMIEEIN
jgi:Holliday junction resolvase RusA-like endonuclease